MTAVCTACTEALKQAAGGEVAELVCCALKLGNVN
jgi:hypothetical protein